MPLPPRSRSLTAGAVLAVAGLALGIAAPRAAAATCSDYPNQAAAQRAADTRDADGDGIYCESLPCPCLKPAGGSSGGSSGSGSTKPKAKPGKYTRKSVKITKVVDGDTLKARAHNKKTRKYNSKTLTVRVIGIDTPESRKPGVPVECGAKEATAYMKKLALNKKAMLIADPTQDYIDKYKRTLGYVMVGKRDVGRAMVAAGWADVYIYGGKAFKRASSYKASKAKASRSNLGVFGACAGDFHSEQ